MMPLLIVSFLIVVALSGAALVHKWLILFAHRTHREDS